MYGAYVLIGYANQIEIAEYTIKVMQRKILKAKANFTKTKVPAHYSRADKIYQANGFCHGWVDEVIKTVTEFAHTDENKKMLAELVEKEKSSVAPHKQQRFEVSGYNEGAAQGKSESLYRPMHDATLKISNK